jgi:hypothetical protein
VTKCSGNVCYECSMLQTIYAPQTMVIFRISDIFQLSEVCCIIHDYVLHIT